MIVGFLAVGLLVFLALVYVSLPLWIKIIVFVINSFVKDPIPVVDEVLMLASIFNNILRIEKAMTVTEWMREHKAVALCTVIGIICLAVLIFLWCL